MKFPEQVLLSVVSCALAGASMVGCATAAADASPGPTTAVEGICQRVMGLSPGERLTGGNWLGNDKLDYWTSHYRGCVMSLSDSLQGVRDTAVVQQAEERCRAKGIPPGTPDLALCVLKTANEHPEPAVSPAAATGLVSLEETGVAPGSFYFATPREITRREQVACAALGLSPAQAEFKSCVQQLRSTFYAIDHPID